MVHGTCASASFNSVIAFVSAVCLCLCGLSISAYADDREQSLPPIVVYSADSSSYIRFGFAGQLRTQFTATDAGGAGNSDESLEMEARRIRFILSGDLFGPDLTFKTQLSAAPGSSELIDFYFDYHLNSRVQFRVGQYKIPFTRYRQQSFSQLGFADWSIVSTCFGAERQMGVTVHNGWRRSSGLTYAFGVFSGTNARASHGVGLARAYGARILNPSALSNPGPRGEFHPELVASIGFGSSGEKNGPDSDASNGNLSYLLNLSGTYDCDAENQKDFVARIAPELQIESSGLAIRAIGYAGFARLLDTRLAALGGLLQASWPVSDSRSIAARYAIVHFEDELVARLPSGQAETEMEFTLGVNSQLHGSSVQWQNDVGVIRRTFHRDSHADVIVRSQFQVVF